jgi:hypothetical protein
MSPPSVLRVLLETGIWMDYPNPRSHVCFSIGECDDWLPAKLIAWQNVPTDSFAMFFETASCYRGEDFFSFITDQGQASGNYIFDNLQPIRSMMVGVKKDGLSAEKLGSGEIDRGCWTSKILGRVRIYAAHEGKTIDVDANPPQADEYQIEWGNGTASAGDLSLNWSEALSPSAIGSDDGVEGAELHSSIASS